MKMRQAIANGDETAKFGHLHRGYGMGALSWRNDSTRPPEFAIIRLRPERGQDCTSRSLTGCRGNFLTARGCAGGWTRPWDGAGLATQLAPAGSRGQPACWETRLCRETHCYISERCR